MLGLTRSMKASLDSDASTPQASRSTAPTSKTPTAKTSGARKSFVSGRTAIVLSLLVVAVILLALPMREYLRQHSEISGAAATAQEQQRRVDELQRRLDKWQNDDYVRAQARARLHFLLPGEVGYVVMGSDQGSGLAPSNVPRNGEQKGPWYSKLWSSVEAADSDAQAPEGAGSVVRAGSN